MECQCFTANGVLKLEPGGMESLTGELLELRDQTCAGTKRWSWPRAIARISDQRVANGG